jgi:hypothetical protein
MSIEEQYAEIIKGIDEWDKKQNLMEMVAVKKDNLDGRNFFLTIFTNDHTPSHAHYYKNKNLIKNHNKSYAKIYLDGDQPFDISQIKYEVLFNQPDLTNGELEEVIEWFDEPNKINPQLNNWEYCKEVWDKYQEQQYKNKYLKTDI